MLLYEDELLYGRKDCEIKLMPGSRNTDKYDSELLEKKFSTIRSEFGKYKEVQLLGLSMEDM